MRHDVQSVQGNIQQLCARFAGILLRASIFVCLAGCANLPGIPGAAAPPASSTPTSAPATPTQPGPPSPTPTAQPVPTTTPTSTPLPDTLTLWTSEQGTALDLVSTLADEFAAQEQLSLTVVARASDDLRVELIAADLAGEALPDLIWGNQDDLAELIIDEQLQPIDQLYQGPPDQFLSPLRTTATHDGRMWGVPLAGHNSLLLLYNRALVPQPPGTTDELIVASRAFAGPDTYGLAAPWTEPRWLLAWLNGYGGALTTPDGTRPTLNTPQMVAALNLLLELQSAAPPEQQSYAESSAAFAAGQVAFTVDGAWALPAYRTPDAALDLGIAPLPLVPATGRRAASSLHGTYLMAHTTLANTDLEHARLFAAYLTTPTVQQRIATTLERLPALRATLADPAVQNNPLLAAAAAQAQDAVGLPPGRSARCALFAIGIWLEPLIAGDIEQQEAAEAMQQEADMCLSR